MSISKKWSRYTKDSIVMKSNCFAVYELAHKETGEILYIGEGRLKNRLLAHFPDQKRPEEIVVGANSYRYELTGSKLRCEQRERALLKEYVKKHGKYPKYNSRLGNV
jgi:hypothetical protein